MCAWIGFEICETLGHFMCSLPHPDVHSRNLWSTVTKLLMISLHCFKQYLFVFYGILMKSQSTTKWEQLPVLMKNSSVSVDLVFSFSPAVRDQEISYWNCLTPENIVVNKALDWAIYGKILGICFLSISIHLSFCFLSDILCIQQVSFTDQGLSYVSWWEFKILS